MSESTRGRPLRVLILMNQVLGWSQSFITRELVQLVAEGVDLHVGTREVHERDDLTPDERALLARVSLLPDNPFTPAGLLRQLAGALTRPWRFAKAVGHFLTFPHVSVGKRARSLICLARATAVARRYEVLDVDLIHAHFLTAPTETAFYLSLLIDRPFGATAHAMDIYTDNSGNRKKLAHAAYVATCTRYNAEHMAAAYGLGEDRLHAVYHGLSNAPGVPRVAPTGRFVFLAVGRMVEKKGFAYLLDALSRLVTEGRDVELRFAGNGPLEDSLRAQVQRLGLEDRVVFLGLVAPSRMTDAYREAHALAVPSVVDSEGDRDGIPNVILEAMSHSLPLVGTRVSGIPEVVNEGENGFLAEPRDSESFAMAMAELLDHPDYVAMGEASLRLVRENFDVVRNVRTLVSVMRDHA